MFGVWWQTDVFSQFCVSARLGGRWWLDPHEHISVILVSPIYEVTQPSYIAVRKREDRTTHPVRLSVLRPVAEG